MKLIDEIQGKINEFSLICREHDVLFLYAFGSSISPEFNEKESDFDFLVSIDEEDPLLKGEKLISLWDKLENFFHRKIDLLTENSIKNPFLKKSIDDTKVLIYDGREKKVFV